MKDMKELFAKGCSCFLALLASLWLGMLFWIVDISGLFAENGSLLEMLVQCIIMTVATGTGMFFYAKQRGYKEGKFKLKAVILSMGIAFVIQLMYAALFSFALYTTGPAFCLGKWIYSILYEIPTKGFPDIYKLITMWLFDLIYLGIVIFGEYMGVKKRLRDRTQLTAK